VPGPSPEQKKAEDKAAAQDREAQAQHAEKVNEITKAYDRDIVAVVTDVAKETERLRSDPEATNDYLKKVGEDVRGGK
jgi:hypothetical protein